MSYQRPFRTWTIFCQLNPSQTSLLQVFHQKHLLNRILSLNLYLEFNKTKPLPYNLELSTRIKLKKPGWLDWKHHIMPFLKNSGRDYQQTERFESFCSWKYSHTCIRDQKASKTQSISWPIWLKCHYQDLP